MTRIALLVVLITGCSFGFVTRPQDATPEQRCTTSRKMPIVDTVFATALLSIGTAMLVTDPQLPFDRSHTMQALGGMEAIEGGAFAAGAVYGWVETAACRSGG
jgi:hypothetical protein